MEFAGEDPCWNRPRGRSFALSTGPPLPRDMEAGLDCCCRCICCGGVLRLLLPLLPGGGRLAGVTYLLPSPSRSPAMSKKKVMLHMPPLVYMCKIHELHAATHKTSKSTQIKFDIPRLFEPERCTALKASSSSSPFSNSIASLFVLDPSISRAMAAAFCSSSLKMFTRISKGKGS